MAYYPADWECITGTGANTYMYVAETREPIYITEPGAYEMAYIPTVPKWWKWYDIFRTWKELKLLPMLSGHVFINRRVQEPLSATQRAKQKRRMFLQKLRASLGER